MICRRGVSGPHLGPRRSPPATSTTRHGSEPEKLADEARMWRERDFEYIYLKVGMASAGGLPICRHGVMGETGITTLASLQVLATIPNEAGGHQVMHQLLEEDIVADGLLEFDAGYLTVPDRPGLGVELDAGRVERYARQYTDNGPFYTI